MKNTIVAIILGITVGLTGCGQPAPMPPNQPTPTVTLPKTLHLKRTDANSSAIIAVNGDITITLNENPSKNGKWVASSSFLTLKDESKKTNSNVEQDRKFIYHAQSAGEGF